MKRMPIRQCMSPCECSLCEKNPPLSLCGLDGKYIVERIIMSRRDEVCFEGTICMDGLPCGLCQPLILRQVSATDIKTVSRACGKEKIRILLACTVMDARGCSAEGSACIEIDSRLIPCTGSVRRGAQIRIASAVNGQPGCFHAVLDISLFTVVTRSELLGGQDCCDPCKSPPPLYPHLSKRVGCMEKSEQFC